MWRSYWSLKFCLSVFIRLRCRRRRKGKLDRVRWAFDRPIVQGLGHDKVQTRCLERKSLRSNRRPEVPSLKKSSRGLSVVAWHALRYRSRKLLMQAWSCSTLFGEPAWIAVFKIRTNFSACLFGAGCRGRVNTRQQPIEWSHPCRRSVVKWVRLSVTNTWGFLYERKNFGAFLVNSAVGFGVKSTSGNLAKESPLWEHSSRQGEVCCNSHVTVPWP